MQQAGKVWSHASPASLADERPNITMATTIIDFNSACQDVNALPLGLHEVIMKAVLVET